MFIIFSTAVAEPPSKRAQPLEQKKEQQNTTHFYQSRYLWGRFFPLKEKSIYFSQLWYLNRRIVETLSLKTAQHQTDNEKNHLLNGTLVSLTGWLFLDNESKVE